MILNLDAFLVTTGFILPYVGETAPAGWLMCTGQPIAASMYSRLCALLPAADRTMPGFHLLPDLRSKAVVGAGTGSGLSAKQMYFSTGTETESLSPGQIPPHTHNLLCNENPTDMERTGTPAGNFFGASYLNRSNGLPVTTPYATTRTEDATMHPTVLQSEGVTERHNNMMPFLVLNFIIKT